MTTKTTTIEINGTEYEVALDVLATTPLRATYLDAVRELIAARASDESDESAAEDRAEAARIALSESTEPEHWTARDCESGVTEDLGVLDLEEARDAAREWVAGGGGEVAWTIWCDARLYSETGHETRATAQIDPDEPACGTRREPREHAWEDDGASGFGSVVSGHGGGVICQYRCAHCGLQRVEDSGAQRRDTGEQGLASVEYREAAGR